jgi:hypothetical protein
MASCVVALISVGGTAHAQETRELGAHEHGVSLLNVAVEGERVLMELEAPGMDIVGFEHEATSEEDLARVEAATAALSEPLTLFVPAADAGCAVESAEASLLEEHEGEEHGEEDHAEEAAAEGEGEGEGGHTEFRASYALRCANPKALDAIEFAFFEVFPGAEEVEVQLVSEGGSTAFEVGRDEPRLDLAGQI